MLLHLSIQINLVAFLLHEKIEQWETSEVLMRRLLTSYGSEAYRSENIIPANGTTSATKGNASGVEDDARLCVNLFLFSIKSNTSLVKLQKDARQLHAYSIAFPNIPNFPNS